MNPTTKMYANSSGLAERAGFVLITPFGQGSLYTHAYARRCRVMTSAAPTPVVEGPGPAPLFLEDVENLVLDVPDGGFYRDNSPLGLAENGLAHRRLVGDLLVGGICLDRADDGVLQDVAVLQIL